MVVVVTFGGCGDVNVREFYEEMPKILDHICEFVGGTNIVFAGDGTCTRLLPSPQQNIMNSLIKRYLNISSSVPYFVLISTCEPQQESEEPVSLCCEVRVKAEALM